MKWMRGFLPNLTIALNVVLLIVVYLDLRNPAMGFLVGAPFLVLVIASVLCSLTMAWIVYADWRRRSRKRRTRQDDSTLAGSR